MTSASQFSARVSSAILATLIAFLPAAAQSQQTGATSNAITGRVITQSGEPVGTGLVYVTPINPTAQAQPIALDPDGSFRMDNLDSGLYRVTVSSPGYVYANNATTDEPQYFRPGDSVTLTLAKGGVITGVVSALNSPVVGGIVRAIRLRDGDGKPLPTPIVYRERFTDDRGVYRLWGLPPGTYVIAAGGATRFGWTPVPTTFDTNVPVYFPSGTRDTASEITVRGGEETTADIQYRSEPGHAVTGVITGTAEAQEMYANVSVSITNFGDRATVWYGNASSYTKYAFGFLGIPDGDYEVSATQYLPSREVLKSQPQGITVRGTDVISLKLNLVHQAGIEGRLVLENDPKAGCGRRRETASQETLVTARRYEPVTKPGSDPNNSGGEQVSMLVRTLAVETLPDSKGSFTLTNLAAGKYRIEVRAPAAGWYIRSIANGPVQSVADKNTVARDGVAVKPGERLSGLIITMSEGAASIGGRVVSETQLPHTLRIYLVPAEKESAGEVLRFFDTRPESDRTFEIGNIPPGKYWLVASADATDELLKPRAIRKDPALRAIVLREAAKSKTQLNLKPCERLKDYELTFLPPDPPKSDP